MGENLVGFRLGLTEVEADLISDTLQKMGAAEEDVNTMASAFPEAIRRALGDGVELKIVG